VSGRLLTLVRCPDGHNQECFYQRHANGMLDSSVMRVPVPEGRKARDYVAIDSLKGLIALVQAGVLELHTWGARIDRLDRPDRLIVDLDPPDGTSFADVRAVAREAGDVFRAVGLEPFAMTTGSRGIHVVAPLRRTADFSAVRELARALAVAVAAADPRRLTTEFHKDKREGRIYVDVLRNNYAQTAIPPYGVRAREGAPVATPLRWEELGDRDLSAGRWTIQSIGARLEHEGGDPWADIARHARDPGPVRRAVQRMAGDRDEA